MLIFVLFSWETLKWLSLSPERRTRNGAAKRGERGSAEQHSMIIIESVCRYLSRLWPPAGWSAQDRGTGTQHLVQYHSKVATRNCTQQITNEYVNQSSWSFRWTKQCCCGSEIVSTDTDQDPDLNLDHLKMLKQTNLLNKSAFRSRWSRNYLRPGAGAENKFK